MTLKSVFEKYKFADEILSDEEWMTSPDEEGHKSIRMRMLFDCWQAIKEELSADTRHESGELPEWLKQYIEIRIANPPDRPEGKPDIGDFYDGYKQAMIDIISLRKPELNK